MLRCSQSIGCGKQWLKHYPFGFSFLIVSRGSLDYYHVYVPCPPGLCACPSLQRLQVGPSDAPHTQEMASSEVKTEACLVNSFRVRTEQQPARDQDFLRRHTHTHTQVSTCVGNAAAGHLGSHKSSRPADLTAQMRQADSLTNAATKTKTKEAGNLESFVSVKDIELEVREEKPLQKEFFPSWFPRWTVRHFRRK